MWPFSKKPPATEKAPDPDMVNIQMLKKEFPLGRSFHYLGRGVVVIGHARPFEYGGYYSMSPELRGQYADDQGVIHEVSLSFSLAIALRMEGFI